MSCKKNKKFVYLKRDYLRKRRNALGLSQAKVADKCEIDPITYNQIEVGKLGHLMNAKRLVSISDCLGIPLDELCQMEIDYQQKLNEANGIKKEE